jgi:hypothetical protein
MSQVLHGLLYLHEQGVIHRDIKGANILTTKQGLVKLADFGVATRTTSLHESSVVGTPYWMAPEVIELSGATTASDIWSLGCTVIELLDGKPPYHKLQPMHALFRIVNDDHPPLPEGASPVSRPGPPTVWYMLKAVQMVRDFLIQCFQKDPNLRVSARKLLKHPWIVNARRSDSVVPKKPTEYDEAVKSVQQWNEALKSSNAGSIRKTCRPMSSSPVPARCDQPPVLNTPARRPLNLAKPRIMTEEFRSPDNATNDNWDADFASCISPGALQLPHLRPHDNFGGLLSAEKLKAFASFETVTEETNWDDNFEGDFTVRGSSQPAEYDVLQTIRPYHPRTLVTNQVRATALSKSTEESKSPKASLPSSPLSRPLQKQAVAAKGAASAKLGREIVNEDYPDLAPSGGPAAGSTPALTKVLIIHERHSRKLMLH